MINRRTFSGTLAASAAAAFASPSVFADSNKPLRVLVGFSAGGSSDVAARILGDKLKDELGVPVVVESRPGAGGQIAAQALKASAADGNTLFLSHDHTISILPLVTRSPGFNPEKDFVPVAGFASFVNCLAIADKTPAKTFPDYLKWVNGDVNSRGSVGVPAPASTPEFLVKLLAEKYKVNLISVPYKGAAPVMSDLLGNQIPAGIGAVPDFIENHRSGRLRIVGVLGAERDPLLPDVPSFHEMGLTGFEDVPYYGFFAPKGTPQAKLDTFNAALQKVLAIESVRKQLIGLGLRAEYSNQQQFTARERAYTQVWARIVKEKGFAPN